MVGGRFIGWIGRNREVRVFDWRFNYEKNPPLIRDVYEWINIFNEPNFTVTYTMVPYLIIFCLRAILLYVLLGRILPIFSTSN